jgi:signal transduction histidine kinase/tetratricopeptide (TPR) repeat protein
MCTRKVQKAGHLREKTSITCLLRIGVFLVIFIFITPFLKAQDGQILHLKLSQQTEIKDKVPLLIQLGQYYSKEKAFIKALDYYEQALTAGKPYLTSLEKIMVLQNIIFSSESLQKYDLALKAYQDIYAIQQKQQDSTRQAMTLHKIAELYEKTGQADMALKQYTELVSFYQKENQTNSLINTYSNIGFIYHQRREAVLSIEYFQKAEQLLRQCSTCLNQKEKTVFYLNKGTSHSAIKEYDAAQNNFEKALSLQKGNPVKEAEVKTYLASNFILSQRDNRAITLLKDAITLASQDLSHPEASKVLLKCYSLLAKIYEAEDTKTQQQYLKLYHGLKEDLNRKEQKLQRDYFDNLVTAEKNGNKLIAIISEKEKAEQLNSQLEKSAQEKELHLKNRELDLLTKNQELQQVQLRNQLLEKEKLGQELLIVEERLKAENQKRKAIQQQLMAEKIKVANGRQQKALLAAKKEKALRMLQLQQAEKQGRLWLTIIGVMLLLLLLIVALFIHSVKTRKALSEQNKLIQEQHQVIELKNEQITWQNEELILKQDEVLKQSEWLVVRNKELLRAQETIEVQHEQLKLYTETLEQQVYDRTRQLTDTNHELVNYNQQLEQFAYIVAHNLRGPVARLLGLTQIIGMPESSLEEKMMMMRKLHQETLALDGIIADLNIILQVKRGMENEFERIKLDDKLEKIISILNEEITESNVNILTDFSEANEVDFVQPYLHSILYNLVSNAIKYRSPDRQSVINIKTSKVDENTICLMVKDNGLGMDLAKYGNMVFGLYKRFHFHKEGKGLGLYLVKTQIEALGGRIELDSEPGEGSAFYLYFNVLQNSLNVEEVVMT